MKGLVIDPDSHMWVEEYGEPLYQSVGKTVGGWIEVVHPKLLLEPYRMIVNEEGLLCGLPLNPVGCALYDTLSHGNPIVGTIVLMKEGIVNGEPDIVGLEDSDIRTLSSMMSNMRYEWWSTAERTEGSTAK